MTQQPSADEVLMGSGRKAAKFENPGAVVGGKIVSPPQTYQEQEVVWDGSRYVKGDFKTFPSGDAIYGIHVDVQTQTRESDDDDGVRRIFVQGKRLKEAVRDAVRATGAHRLEVGGELWVKYTGDGEAANPKATPPKLYAAKYTAPSGPASQDEAWGPPPATQGATPPPMSAPAPQQQDTPLPDPTPHWGDEPPF